MSWIWPLKNSTPLMPDEPGQFGTVRKFDRHTGVDLYCELGQEVLAVEDGEVISIENFTGPGADDPSPWWNDTQAILVKGASGVVAYGEVATRVRVGDLVQAGQVLACVERPVLRSFKGRPMVMLHIELMTPDATVTQWWERGEDQPEVLLDPTPHLMDAAQGIGRNFRLEDYDGTSFRDPKATPKNSKWWAVWDSLGTDDEFLGYCDLHCETPRALFHRVHIERLHAMAGVDFVMDGDGFGVMHVSYARPLIQAARQNMETES